MTTVRSHLLLTGPPGSGKTTVLLRTAALLRDSGSLTFGFTTPEIREGRTRTGFALELLDGTRDILASKDFPGRPRVGRYAVRLDAMDRLVVPEIARGLAAAESGGDTIIVMDEIGKMELFSKTFRDTVLAALNSPARILATIMAKPHPFADALKARPDVKLISVARDTRDALPNRLAKMIQTNR